MTAAALVATLRARGVILEPHGNRLRVRPATAVMPEEVEALRRLKPDVLRLLTGDARPTPASRLVQVRLAYREALRRVWTLAAQGEHADPAACLAALDELARRLDDVGEPAATELRRRWAREWHRETGRCPTCGEPGPYHDPAQSGEAT